MKNARPVGNETLVVVEIAGCPKVNGWASKDQDGWTTIRVIGQDESLCLKPGTKGVFEVINDGLFGIRKEFC